MKGLKRALQVPSVLQTWDIEHLTPKLKLHYRPILTKSLKCNSFIELCLCMPEEHNCIIFNILTCPEAEI